MKDIKKLDRNKIHILYFHYYANWHNFYHSPLMFIPKFYYWLAKKPLIDHTCHISRFVYDRSKREYRPKIFEANFYRGMEENDLIDRLKNVHGKVYIETLGPVNKKKAKKFELQYRGTPYNKEKAAFAGLDINWLDKILSPNKKKGGFCSWLVTKFLQDQCQDIKLIVEDGNADEITPVDLYNLNLGKKLLLHKK